jgi:transposase
MALDDLVGDEHPVRVVWAYVEGLNLDGLYAEIRAVEGHVGRSPIDPKILMALWLYATLDGVGSARHVARLCQEHAAYQWICGGVSVNYHTVSDFRTGHPEVLDRLLTDSVAALVHDGLVTLSRVAQDGMRVRASAGASSYRRRETLEACQAEAREQVAALREELDLDPEASDRRQKAARRRAAQERVERVGRALGKVAELEAKKKAAEKDLREAAAGHDPDEPGKGPNGTKEEDPEEEAKRKKKEPRASTTDPEAVVMKMADGGFRPAHNVQFATDTGSQIITGVAVLNSGSDLGQMGPMVAQHEERYERAPEAMLVDGGFAKKEDIEAVEGGGTKVYAPVRKPRNKDQDRYAPRPGDGPGVVDWRVRMKTEEGKTIYKERAATAECVNAIARNRGLRQFLVRGLKKVRCVGLWYALVHNLVRAAALRARAALRAESLAVAT